MADMAWRPFRPRARARAPTVPSPPPLSDHTTNTEVDDHRERVSSYASLSSHLSFSSEPPTPSTREEMLVNDEDKVWYNPSLEQMAEALQVNLMANRVLRQIPVEHNVYVLHLIEGFRHMQDKINAADASRNEAYMSRDQLSQDFKTVENEWVKREAQYKAEVKRLEVLLAHTSQDGLETVTLARANSVVDRAGPDPRQFVTRLQKLRSQDVRPSPNSNNFIRGYEYDTFLGQVPLTGASLTETLRQMDGSNGAIKNTGSTDLSRLPSILDKEKDFITSQLLKCSDKKASRGVRRRPRLHLKSTPARIEVEDSIRQPPSSSVALLESPQGHTRRNSRGQDVFESSSSSSGSDDDGQRYWIGHTTRYLQPAVHNMDRCRTDTSNQTTAQVRERRGSNVTTTKRFSFAASEDTVLHGDMCQESGRDYYSDSERRGNNQGAQPYSTKQASTEHPITEPSDWHDGACSRVAAAVSALESPPGAGRNDGTRSTAKPCFRSIDPAAGNEMVNYGHLNKSAKSGGIKVAPAVPRRSDYSRTSNTDLDKRSPVSRRLQVRSSAQLAASRAVQMRTQQYPHSGG